MKINTCSGQIDSRDLGITLMHEHVIVVERNLRDTFPGWFDEEDTISFFCSEMEKLKKMGLKTFVDATPINLGRDVRVLAKAAEQSGLNILCCSGLYWQEIPFFNLGTDPQVLAKYLLGEVRNGIEGTDIRPAFIKSSSDMSVMNSPGNVGQIHAAAITAAESGLPLYCHTDNKPGVEDAPYQRTIIKNYIKEPWKIAYGHVFGHKDQEYLKDLLDGGSYIFCDQIGYDDIADMDTLADMTAALCAQGYSKQICLSTDHLNHSDWYAALTAQARDKDNNPLLFPPSTSGRGIIFDTFVPKLLERGVKQEDVDNMILHNPRRYFEGEAI